MTPREELLAAAQVIRERGWFRQAPDPNSNQVCLITACIDAKGYSDRAYCALHAVTSVSLMSFNDYHCELASDAIAALEIAADLAT